MKTITVRLPEPLVAEIEAEARERKISKSDLVRERLESTRSLPRPGGSLASIAGLIGAAADLPRDLGARRDHYLKKTGYGRNRANR